MNKMRATALLLFGVLVAGLVAGCEKNVHEASRREATFPQLVDAR